MNNFILPDVSFWQDRNDTPQGVNFDKMRQVTSAVIIRAGQNTWLDQDFKRNWQASKSAGMNRGAYWFYDSRIDPKRQADLWGSAFDGDFGELPLWCDFEDRFGGAFGRWQNWYDFIEAVKVKVPNKEIGIYTGYFYWTERTVSVNIPKASLDYFKQYPLWIAAYNNTAPIIPKPFDTWALWQFTDNGDGAPYGVESKNIDLSYYNGSEEDFNRRFVASMPKPVNSSYLVTAQFDKAITYKEQI